MTKKELAYLADCAEDACGARKRRPAARTELFARLVLGLRSKRCQHEGCDTRVSVGEQRRRGGALCLAHSAVLWQSALARQDDLVRRAEVVATLRQRLDCGPLYSDLA